TSHAAESHKHQAPKRLRIALITVSSSRYRDPSIRDDSGEKALEICRKAGHDVLLEVVDDEKQMIRLHLLRSLFEEDADVVILMGGTGLAPRDVTIEAISPLLEKQIDGFGEIFRRLSYDSIGTPAIMSRTLAGIVGKKPVFCLPGSPQATKVGVELALKELSHAVFIASNEP
ncbi:MAG: MogA/MoaB family molybdenum cofactor biosynthesis protein, partial [Nitrososphaerales archaeon]